MPVWFSKAYKKEIWVLGPPQTSGSFPGAFPTGFIKHVRKYWWGKKRLWMCSGSFKDPTGLTLDIRKCCSPDIMADAESLPFKDDTFDFVLADPPYSDVEAEQLYGTGTMPSTLKLINEGVRVIKPGGRFLLLHRIFPGHEPKINKVELEAIIGIVIINFWGTIRALSVFRKAERLESFDNLGGVT